jgi:hypothetical protein
VAGLRRRAAVGGSGRWRLERGSRWGLGRQKCDRELTDQFGLLLSLLFWKAYCLNLGDASFQPKIWVMLLI